MNKQGFCLAMLAEDGHHFEGIVCEVELLELVDLRVLCNNFESTSKRNQLRQLL